MGFPKLPYLLISACLLLSCAAEESTRSSAGRTGNTVMLQVALEQVPVELEYLRLELRREGVEPIVRERRPVQPRNLFFVGGLSAGTWQVILTGHDVDDRAILCGQTMAEVLEGMVTTVDIPVLVSTNCDPAELLCADGLDNDEDGQTDCADQDCADRPCDDGLVCTQDEICVSEGVCGGGGPTECVHEDACMAGECTEGEGCSFSERECPDDGDICTVTVCDYDTGCGFAPFNCDDWNLCTLDGCDSAEGCVHTPLSCRDDDVCTLDRCRAWTGCMNTPITGGSCNDGSSFTENDTCIEGSCVGFVPLTGPPGVSLGICEVMSCTPMGCSTTRVDCDDRDLCTLDLCDTSEGCVYFDVTCDDGNECTVDSCDPVKGCLSEPLDCDDDDACTVDSCDPTIGCINERRVCDDRSVCTVDSCDVERGCIFNSIACGDDNACTDDRCDPDFGCFYPPVECFDGDECTTDLCDPIDGCVFETIDCDDDNAWPGFQHFFRVNKV